MHLQVYTLRCSGIGPELTRSDSILFLLTTAIAALRTPLVVLRSIASHILLLALFATFVLWNGSVVLGKSCCTIHIHTNTKKASDDCRRQISTHRYHTLTPDAVHLAIHCSFLCTTTSGPVVPLFCSASTSSDQDQDRLSRSASSLSVS